MFKSIRYTVATYLMKRADAYVRKGDFENIKKGLTYMKYSLYIVPHTKEISDFVNDIHRIAEEHLK